MIEEINKQLLESFLLKEQAEGQLKIANERIVSLRNVLAGMDIVRREQAVAKTAVQAAE